MDDRLLSLKKYLHIIALLLGVITLVTARFIDLERARWLYTFISLGPILGGLVTAYRYRVSAGDDKAVARIVVECGWICLSFGAGFWMLLPSAYYAVQPAMAAALTVESAVLVIAGLYTLVSIGKSGYSLTP